MAFVSAITVVYLLRDYPYGPMGSRHDRSLPDHPRASRGRLVTAALLYAGHLGGRFALDLTWSWALDVSASLAWALLLLAVGEIVRVRRERAAEPGRRRAETDAAQAGEERLRIARELHDVVAHHMSLINVQAGVALHLVDRKPEQVADRARSDQGRQQGSPVELRSLVGVLRDDDEAAPARPAPP